MAPHRLDGTIGRAAFLPLVAALAVGIAGPATAQTASSTSVAMAWTNFLGASLSGPADGTPRIGGRIDVWATLDGRDVGLWQGLTFNVQPELVYGTSVNRQGSGEILPLNTALSFPSPNVEDFDLSFTIGQRIGKAQLTMGKINTVDLKKRTPLLGGGGIDGFQYLQFAAPVTLFTPPKILGALLTAPVGGVSVTIGVWDPRSMINRTGFDRPPFETGVNGMISVSVPVSIAGKRGYQNIMVSGTSTRGIDLANLPDVTLPPDSSQVLGTRSGGWLARYTFQQYVWTDPTNPKRGWGLFGDFSVWDSNPTPFEWGMSIGITGELGLPGARADDRFGIGFFRFSIADDLVKALDPLLKIESEHGMEAFYTLTFNDHVALTANVQWLAPARSDLGDSVLGGLRLRTRF